MILSCLVKVIILRYLDEVTNQISKNSKKIKFLYHVTWARYIPTTLYICQIIFNIVEIIIIKR